MADDNKKLNREAWLHRMAEMLRPWFRDHGYPIHGRITVTMAVMKPRLRWRTLGLCCVAVAPPQRQTGEGAERSRHIFINAYEDSAHENPVVVAGTLVHEIVHAILPTGERHGKLFKQAATAVGLTGKMTETTAGPALVAHLEKLVAALPPLPRYGVVAPPRRPRGGGDNSMLKFQCPACKVTVYLRPRTLERAGDPPCWNPDCEAIGDIMEEKVDVQ